MGTAQMTTDHETIKEWAKARGGKPAEVEDTDDGEIGVLRIEFPDSSGGKKLKRLQWPSLFRKMDKEHLALVYQEETKHGEISRFCKFVHAPEGILEKLHEEHERVRKILSDLSETTTNAVKTRPKLLEQLRELLLPHMAAEKKAFYKPLRKADADPEQLVTVLEAYEEHRHAKEALRRLEKADPESAVFTARLSVLKELVEHHIEEEESKVFDVAIHLVGPEALEEMQTDYERREQKKLRKL
jgi:hemerythrin-like domain-containing protein